jgi:hypothetical protein
VRRLLLALVALAVLALPASAGASLKFGNLLVNGNAETPPIANGEEAVPPTGWGVTGNFTAGRYTGLGITSAKQPQAGEALFAGGNGASSSAVQTVDVAYDAVNIDAGRVEVRLDALIGGFGDQNDQGIVELTPVDGSSGGQTGTPIQIGPVLATERGNQTILVAKTATMRLPAGTRALVVAMTMTRTGGIYNDGYIDEVSLIDPSAQPPRPAGPTPTPATNLPPPTPTPPAFGPTGVFQGLPPTTRCLSKRNFVINVRNRGRKWVSVVAVLDRKRLRVRRPNRTTRKHHQVRIDLRGFPKRRVVVRLSAVSNFAETVSGRRVYHTCESFRRQPKRNRL